MVTSLFTPSRGPPSLTLPWIDFVLYLFMLFRPICNPQIPQGGQSPPYITFISATHVAIFSILFRPASFAVYFPPNFLEMLRVFRGLFLRGQETTVSLAGFPLFDFQFFLFFLVWVFVDLSDVVGGPVL